MTRQTTDTEPAPDIRDFALEMLTTALLRETGKPTIILCWRTAELTSDSSLQVRQEAERLEAPYFTLTIDVNDGISADFHWDIPTT